MRRAHDKRSWMSQAAVDRLTDVTIDLLRENMALKERLAALEKVSAGPAHAQISG